MHAVKHPGIETSIQEAVDQWKRIEGIIHIEILPPTRIILIETLCNPAAITAPIPSFFEGFQVRYYQRPPLNDEAIESSKDMKLPID